MSIRRIVLENTDYEPYDKRDTRHQTNRFETLVHLVKALVGTGVLAMPQAYLNSGLLVGTIGVIITITIMTFSLHLLFDAMYFISKRDKIPQTTYPDAFKEGLKLGPKCFQKCADGSPYVVNFFIIVYQFGIMCVYFVFCAKTVKQLIDYYTPRDSHVSIEIYMAMMLVPFLALTYIKNLKFLAPVSNVANWLTLLALICIYFFFFEQIEPIQDRKLFAHITLLPLFIGTTMFSALAVGPVLSIELSMENPRHWRGSFGILNQGMFIVAVLSIFTGFFGYWRYGEHTASVVTLNINIEHYLAQVIRVLFCVAICLSYPLQAYPAHEVVWSQYVQRYMETSNHKLLWDYTLRTIFVLASYMMAVFIPRIGLFISLFGTFCLSILGIMFPALLDICIRWPDDLGKGYIILIRDILIMIFGFICWVSGTYISIKEIVESLLR